MHNIRTLFLVFDMCWPLGVRLVAFVDLRFAFYVRYKIMPGADSLMSGIDDLVQRQRIDPGPFKGFTVKRKPLRRENITTTPVHSYRISGCRPW